jgi:ankyrin repeat protein
LHEAVSCNNLDIASFLLIKGANSRTLTIDEYTILQLAIVSHSTEVLRAILDQNIVDINEVTSWGSALHLAVSREDQDAL